MSVFNFTSAWDTPVQVGVAQDAAQDAKAKARSTADDLVVLRGQVDRLQMICEAMWTVIKEQSGADDERLLRLVQTIDLRDGELNGRSKSQPQSCKQCGRVVSTRTRVCMYCGAQNAATSVF
jgi:hypothetical protein